MASVRKVGGKAGVPSTLLKKGTTAGGYTRPSSVYSGPAGGWSQPQVAAGDWKAATSTNPSRLTPPPPAPLKTVSGAPSDVASSYLNPRAGALKQFNLSARDNIYADLAKNAGMAQADYGYTGQDTNGDGIPDTGFQVDPSNPFSKAQLLMRQYSQARGGTKTSMAAQGQLYSGALQSQLDELGFQEQGAMDSNLKGFNRYLDSLVQSRRDAALQAERANADVDWDALVAAINAPRSADAPAAPASSASGVPVVSPTIGAPIGAPITAPAAAKPKAGYQFVQDSGSRAGLSYKVVMKGSTKYRYYENGDKVKVG